MDNSSPRMPQVFEINIAGEGISPESIRASDLADILKSIEESISSVAIQMNPDLDLDDFIVGLVQIQRGSARLAFSSSQPSIAKNSFEDISTAVSEKKIYRLPSTAVEGINKIVDFSKRRGCVIELRPDIQKEPTAFIQPDTDFGIKEKQTISSDSVIFGNLERIGGVRPMARIRISEHEVISCSVSYDLAKSLASRLYENIGLTGRATWNTQNWSMTTFEIHNITQYEGGSIKDAFRELANAAGDAWSDIDDVKEYIRSLRED